MRNRWRVFCYVLASILIMSTSGAHAAAEPEGPTQLVQRLVKAINSIKPTNNGGFSAAGRAANIAAANLDTRAQLVTKDNVEKVGKRFEN